MAHRLHSSPPSLLLRRSLRPKRTSVASLGLVVGLTLWLGACTDANPEAPPAAQAALAVAPTPSPQPSAIPTATTAPTPNLVPTPTPTPIWRPVDLPDLNATGEATSVNALVGPPRGHPEWLAAGAITDRDAESYRPVIWTSESPETGAWGVSHLPLGTHEDGSVSELVVVGEVRVAGGVVERAGEKAGAVWVDSGSGWSEASVLPKIDGVPASLHHVASDGSSVLVHASSRKWPNDGHRRIVWHADLEAGTNPLRWTVGLEIAPEIGQHWINSVRHVGGQYMAVGWQRAEGETSKPVVWRSATGLEWEAHTLASGGLLYVWANDIARFGDEFIVGGAEQGKNGTRAPVLWRSKSGEKWVRKKPRVTADFGRITTAGFAIEELVVSGEALYALTDNSFQAGVLRSESVSRWELLPPLAERTNSDDLRSAVPTDDGLALLQNGEVASFAEGEWTRTGGDLVRDRNNYWLGSMASDGTDVVIAGRRHTADGNFAQVRIRRDGEWRLVSLAGSGIAQVGVTRAGWLMVGSEEPRGQNPRVRLWQSLDLDEWVGRTVWDDGGKTLPHGFEVLDGNPVVATTHVRLNEASEVYLFPTFLRLGPDVVAGDPIDFQASEWVQPDADGWYRELRGTSCTLGESALFFHVTSPNDPINTPEALRPIVVSADLSTEFGERLRSPGSDSWPATNECVGLAGRYWLVGSETDENDNVRGRLWTSRDGLEWEHVDLDLGDVLVYSFSDVIALRDGLLIVGRTDEQYGRPLLVYVPVDPLSGDAGTPRFGELNVDTEDTHALSIVDVILAGDELLMHGTERGYNRVWSASPLSLLESLGAP